MQMVYPKYAMHRIRSRRQKERKLNGNHVELSSSPGSDITRFPLQQGQLFRSAQTQYDVVTQRHRFEQLLTDGAICSD